MATLSLCGPVAPVIVADNAYVFLAANRLHESLGLTIPPATRTYGDMGLAVRSGHCGEPVSN